MQQLGVHGIRSGAGLGDPERGDHVRGHTRGVWGRGRRGDHGYETLANCGEEYYHIRVVLGVCNMDQRREAKCTHQIRPFYSKTDSSMRCYYVNASDMRGIVTSGLCLVCALLINQRSKERTSNKALLFNLQTRQCAVRILTHILTMGLEQQTHCTISYSALPYFSTLLLCYCIYSIHEKYYITIHIGLFYRFLPMRL